MITVALIAVAFIWFCWVLYAAIMNAARLDRLGTLTRMQTALAKFTLAVGFVANLVLNVVVATVLFLELPREIATSGRLWRLSQGPQGWRQRLAEKIRSSLLDGLDTKHPDGKHRA